MEFDFDTLRIPANFEKGIAAKKILTTIPCRKPRSGIEYFRIRPGSEWQFETYLLDLGEGDNEKYMALPQFLPELLETGRLRGVTIYAGIFWGTGIFFLTDIPHPNSDGTENPFNKSRRSHYETATSKWIKIKSNMELGAYEIFEAQGNIPEPEWPETPATMVDAIKIAFKERLIDKPDHPVLKKIRGEL